MWARSGAFAAALLAAAGLAGCGIGPGAAPSGVELLVTRNFGSQRLLDLRSPKVSGSETVMSLLMRNAKVGTEYGGGFVESIDGLSGGHEGGSPRDWFYYVDGKQAEKGAAETVVHSGERIWWDLHNWSQSEDIPAVVGSFPAPFIDGIEGKRLPIAIECAESGSAPCKKVSAELSSLGIVAGFAALGTPGEVSEADELKILVGTWSQLSRSAAVATIAKGPAIGGVYIRVREGGRQLDLLNEDGAIADRLDAGSGLIAATRYAGSAPAWVVTGTNVAGVLLAASSFNAAALDGHFAVAVLPTATGPRVIGVPVTG